MKLSVCIPIYQQDVTHLVTTLKDQLVEQPSLAYEFCLVDDGSKEAIREKNRALNTINEVRYKELKRNVGRSVIRNVLAKFAQGKYCLFLDSDVIIHQPDFIEKYQPFLHEDEPMLVNGGCEYKMKKEERKNKALRYKYGKFVEELQFDKNGSIESPFVGCNFLVSRTVFSTIQFDEKLVNYGFEDLLFSLQFEDQFGPCQMIANPVLITDVDTNEVFLEKTTDAMQNLAILYHQKKLVPQNNIRLLLVYEELKRKGLLSSFYQLSKNMTPFLLMNLTSSNPSLKVFQFFKLITFIKNLREIETQ